MTPEALQRLEAVLARPRVHPLLEPEETFLVTVERGDLRALLEERRELLSRTYKLSSPMFEGVWVGRAPYFSPNTVLVSEDVWGRMTAAPPTTPSPEEEK